jgi:hypothetical protein
VEVLRTFLGDTIIDENKAGFDQFLNARAAQLSAVSSDDAVEPLAGFFRSDGEFVLHPFCRLGVCASEISDAGWR